MINLEKFTIIQDNHFILWKGSFVSSNSKYAKCKSCGEIHFVNENEEIQVNGKIVKECINCAYKERGIILW